MSLEWIIAETPTLEAFYTCSAFEHPGLFCNSRSLSVTDNTECNLITFLAAFPTLGVPFLLETGWQPSQLATKGGPRDITQVVLREGIDFVYKRVVGKDRSSPGETFPCLIDEINLLCQPAVKGHPNIARLRGICWEVPLTTPLEKSEAWSILVFEETQWGDFWQSTPQYALKSEEHSKLTPAEPKAADVFLLSLLCVWFIVESQNSKNIRKPEDRSLQRIIETSYNAPLDAPRLLVDQKESLSLFSQTYWRNMQSGELHAHVDAAIEGNFMLFDILQRLYTCDFRLRLCILKTLTDIVAANPESSLAPQLKLCRELGFGSLTWVNSETTISKTDFDMNLGLAQGKPAVETGVLDFACDEMSRISSGVVRSYIEQEILNDAKAVTKQDLKNADHLLGPSKRVALDIKCRLLFIMAAQNRHEEA
ncbi:hypothetical protein QBC36DRAFT_294068 [Triangularia setosa]|uniref:Uncharacterized protein n=1 Tax=Triangularia setosa TaxID=2587417 RepID=A0AAN7A486_9PEZI|nr:hypothetical protein QBC36DRAFT_294068 [Podospora setosa]